MNRFVRYENGNYTVTIDTFDGTKIRENDLPYFRAEFPESADIKITNRCDMNCVFCHEASTKDGKHGDIMNAKFIDNLHPYTELAIGGGNVLEHPQLIPFLKKCKNLNLIPSFTVNQKHFMEHYSYVKSIVDHKLIYGVGISLTNPTDEFIEKVKTIPNAVIHVINGIVTLEQLKKLKDNGLKILILGYKEFRRGKDLYSIAQERFNIIGHQVDLYAWLSYIVTDNWFEVVSFDNLAVEQLDVKRLLTEDEWNEFYMGADGTATMYVDLVEEQFAKSSTSTERYPLMDNIVDMFNKIRID